MFPKVKISAQRQGYRAIERRIIQKSGRDKLWWKWDRILQAKGKRA